MIQQKTTKKETFWEYPKHDKIKYSQAESDLVRLTDSGSKEEFVDFLSTGQWVDKKKYGPQWRRLKANTPEDRDGDDFIDTLVGCGLVIRAGNLDSVRMVSDAVIAWRDMRGLTLLAKDQTCPRFFGGIIEDDVWCAAPLRSASMVTLAARDGADLDEIRRIALEYGGVPLFDSEAGLMRVMCAYSQDLIFSLKSRGLTRTIRSTEVRRRELVDIPENILNALSDFYLMFTKSTSSSQMSIIKKHVPKEFFESQLYLWICDAIRRFDERASVPFGAYLTERIKHWSIDLAKVNLDSMAASQQNLAQKAEKIEGSIAEKARVLNVSEDKLSAAIETSLNIYAMSNDGMLRFDEYHDDLAPLKDRVAAPSVVGDENVSRIHRIIVDSSFECSDPDRSLVNVVGSFYGGCVVDSYGEELLDILQEQGELRRFVTWVNR